MQGCRRLGRYVDDRLRSRVAGMRLTISFGISSIAVWLLGPMVKAGGFAVLFAVMAGAALCTAIMVAWLPDDRAVPAGEPAGD